MCLFRSHCTIGCIDSYMEITFIPRTILSTIHQLCPSQLQVKAFISPSSNIYNHASIQDPVYIGVLQLLFILNHMTKLFNVPSKRKESYRYIQHASIYPKYICSQTLFLRFLRFCTHFLEYLWSDKLHRREIIIRWSTMS